MTEVRESSASEPVEPEPGDEELDAAAIAALLRGGIPHESEPRPVARAAEPTLVERAAEPTPVAPAPEPTLVAPVPETPVPGGAEPAEEWLEVQLTPSTEEPEEAPRVEAPVAAEHTQEPVPQIVAPEPARGPSWLGRAVRNLCERWAEVPARAARLAARLREGAGRARCAPARSSKKEAPTTEAVVAAEPPVEDPAPARAPEAAGEGSEARSRVAWPVLVSLCVNMAAMAALLAVLLRPYDAVPAPAEGRSPDHAAARAPVAARGGARPGPMLKLGDFVVLLHGDADGPEGYRERYARITFDLELPDETAQEAASSRLPFLRDAVLSYLSDFTAEDLRGSEALEHVKAALAKRFSEAAPNVPVRAVYLSDLVVQ